MGVEGMEQSGWGKTRGVDEEEERMSGCGGDETGVGRGRGDDRCGGEVRSGGDEERGTGGERERRQEWVGEKREGGQEWVGGGISGGTKSLWRRKEFRTTLKNVSV